MNSKTLLYILKRILLAILTVFVVIAITFFSMHAIPGGPFLAEKAPSPEVQKRLEEKFGLDKPLPEQFLLYLGQIITYSEDTTYTDVERPVQEGDSVSVSYTISVDGEIIENSGLRKQTFIIGENAMNGIDQTVGMSKDGVKDINITLGDDYAKEEYRGQAAVLSVTVLNVQEVSVKGSLKLFDSPSIKQDGRSVGSIIGGGLAVSAKLGLIASAIALVIGVVLGAVAALKRNKLIDRIIMVLTTAFVSMPSFIMGTLLLLLFTLTWPIFPANGAADAGAAGLVLPIFTLSLSPMAHITRLTRSSMLDVLGQDYIRTAKAKGVSKNKIIFGHALKNALIPVITYFGPMLAYIVTGSLVVEQIFAVPGIGRDFVSSITNRDYPVIMGTTIVLAALIVIMNLVGDIMYKVVDPRINFE